MSKQKLRKRLHELADRMGFIAERSLEMYPTKEYQADLRALLDSERELRRINAALRKALRIERDYEGLSGTSYELLERENIKL